jgi:hypothetical protein
MLGRAFLGSAFLAATVLCQQFPATSYGDTCKKIEGTISSASQVFYPGGSIILVVALTRAQLIPDP